LRRQISAVATAAAAASPFEGVNQALDAAVETVEELCDDIFAKDRILGPPGCSAWPAATTPGRSRAAASRTCMNIGTVRGFVRAVRIELRDLAASGDADVVHVAGGRRKFSKRPTPRSAGAGRQ
jgi:hypothetical protein